MVLAVLYLVAQVFGGYLSGSLALIAEAGHKLADVSALALALFASWFASLPASPKKTFGYHRLEILAALINGLVLFFIATMVIQEAIGRLYGIEGVHGHHHHIEGGLMLWVALIGLIINGIAAYILWPSKDSNLNVKGAYFHVVADIMGSVGTIITALLILWFDIQWADAVISVLIALMILFNAVRIQWEAINILLEGAPPHASPQAVERYIRQNPDVLEIHDLHVWTITTGKDALMAHVVVSDRAFHHQTLVEMEKKLRDEFGLCHITVQLEPPGFTEEAEICV